MLRTVKINESEYRTIKAFAAKRGQYLSFVLSEAIRQYLKGMKQQDSESRTHQQVEVA